MTDTLALPPDLESVLAGLTDAPAEVILAALRQEQKRYWQRGQRVLVEACALRLPALRTNAELLLDVIYGEVLSREEAGEKPQLDEYLERFPEHADALRRQFALHAALEPSTRDSVVVPLTRRLDPGDPVPPLAVWGEGYQLLEKLGEGGMGVVYKAHQTSLNRFVALKMLLGGDHAQPEELRRFRAEAEAVAQLHHPNIVQIYDVGELDGRAYLALEYMAGGSLAHQLAGAALEPQAAARLLEVLAGAVQAAHDRHVVHRDLKPANVLLAGDGTPKIADFGLAKKLDADSNTAVGAILGTPSYMPPEQALGRGDQLGPAADIYSLGAILYETLTGRPPFKGATQFDTLEQVVSREPVPPRQLQPTVPRDLEIICLKCLRKEPDRRYLTARALADDLHRFQHHEPILARPASVWERAVKWTKRRPAAALLLLVSGVALLGLGALGWAWNQSRLEAAQQGIELARKDAESARRELRERDRLQEETRAVDRLLHAGDDALRARDPATAADAYQRAVELIDREPALAAARAEAIAGRDRARLQQVDRENFHSVFPKRRDHALELYHEPLYAGALDRERTAAAARAALEVFGVNPQRVGPPVYHSDYLNELERAEVTSGCYEMLLVLSETFVPPSQSGDAAGMRAAVAVLDQAEQLGLRTAALHLRRARLWERLGEPARASQEREQAAQLRTVAALDAVSAFWMGAERYREATLQPGKSALLAEAVAAFERALRARPDSFWAEFYLAVCYLQRDEPLRVLSHLSECRSRRPGFSGTYLARGTCYAEVARRHQAAGQRAEAGQAFAAADADLDAALARAPQVPALRYAILTNRGLVRLWQNRLAEAAADLQEAIGLKGQDFNAHVNLAEIRKRQQRFADAHAHLDEAIRLQPRQAILYRTRAQVHIQWQRDSAHQQRLWSGLPLGGVAPALLQGSLTGLQQQQRLAALDDLHEALRRESRPANLAVDRVQRGLLLHGLRKPEQALVEYDLAQRALAEAQLAAPYPGDLADLHRLRADTLLILDRPQEAFAALSEHLKLHRTDARAYRDRGVLRTRISQDSAGAVDDFSAALALKRHDPLAHLYRGWALLNLRSPQLARHDFRRALELDPNQPRAHLGQSYACLSLGERDQSLSSVRAALEGGLGDARDLYIAARIFVDLAAHLESQPAQAALRRQHEEQARDLLRNSFAALTGDPRQQFWQELRKDPAVTAFRRHAWFPRLLEQFGLE